MIKVAQKKNGGKRAVTFTVPDEDKGVSVVGNFNDWDPMRHELIATGDGQRATTILLPPGSCLFRYLAQGGQWSDDETADKILPDQGSVIDIT